MEKEREIRLRQRIEELVRSRVGTLEQDISRLQREVNQSFTHLLERTDAAATMSEGDESLAQIAAEVTAQVDQATAESVRLGADIALLRDSIVELNDQHTQAEVLNALVARAANFAPRVVLFVVKATNALAWAARGLDDSIGNQTIRGLTVSLQSDSVLRGALNAQQTFYGSPDQQAENALIFSRLGNLQPQRVLAVPLKVRGKAAAILYADPAERGAKAVNVEAIELLVNTAGMVVELVSLRARMAEAAPAAKPVAQTPAAQAPAAKPSVPPAPAPPVVLPPSAPPVAERPAPVAERQFQTVGAPEPAPPAPGFYTPSAAPEPPRTPPPPVPPPGDFWTTRPSGSLNPPPAEPPRPAEPPASRADMGDEEKAHNDARRFARLLVSEIKLYNEQKVAEGRRNSDLYDRLKEDIDRSRQMYEKRVTPSVAAKFDYFYDELVNTLAEGDAARLGSDFPGPSVAV